MMMWPLTLAHIDAPHPEGKRFTFGWPFSVVTVPY